MQGTERERHCFRGPACEVLARSYGCQLGQKEKQIAAT